MTDKSERQSPTNKCLITVAKFTISFVILGYLFYQAREHEQFAVLAESDKRVGWIALAVVTGFIACASAFVRWHLLVISIGLKFRLSDAIRLGFLGHLFNLMSFGVLGGDAIKSLFVAKQMPGKRAEAIATVFADRLVGLVAMFLFAGIGYVLADFSSLESTNPAALASIQLLCQICLAVAVAALAGLLTLTVFRTWQQWWLVRRLIALPRIGPLIHRLVNVITIYQRRQGVLFSAILISLLSNILFSVTIYSVARGISDTYPSLVSHLVISPIALVANAVPLPGGLGGMEFALDFLYRGFSQAELPSEHGFVVALGLRVILLLVAAVGIFVYLSRKSEIDHLEEVAHDRAESERGRSGDRVELSG